MQTNSSLQHEYATGQDVNDDRYEADIVSHFNAPINYTCKYI